MSYTRSTYLQQSVDELDYQLNDVITCILDNNIQGIEICNYQADSVIDSSDCSK